MLGEVDFGLAEEVDLAEVIPLRSIVLRSADRELTLFEWLQRKSTLYFRFFGLAKRFEWVAFCTFCFQQGVKVTESLKPLTKSDLSDLFTEDGGRE